ncbi:leucine-rich melanocyte differentiation-associated protein-like isoform X1 [Zerene cesonia]|uniref:leucine-rich melanocyte differentiation-associated protein-like isoform X1 n=1 Tax=Zerene cesonia TaxID=33412 RepID=UPI0018E514D7|nr:leucine-rich melanocyte differentiation-associated protein-like isoform X1 [Zerene cesonia]
MIVAISLLFSNLTRILFENQYALFNVSAIAVTLLETSVCPLAIVKLMLIVTRNGGIVNSLKCIAGPRYLKYRYVYNLKLTTHDDARRVSYVTVVLEGHDSVNKCQLSYCGQDCQRIPPALWNMYGAKVNYLDLSYNSIETLKGLDNFTRLEELILDNNKLGDNVSFPYLPYLQTLSLNNNQIENLESLVGKLSEAYPSLSYLSLLSNKACPNQLSDLDKDESDYQRYRYFVIYKLKHLRFLDSRRVSERERSEALARGEFMRVRRPPRDVTAYTPGDVIARPLPLDLASLGKHKGAYGKCLYKYTGKHSEGNRFILNSDL